MELFKGTNLIDFIDRVDNEEKCKKYLAAIKWANGFTCSTCNHSHYWTQKKDPFVKVCKGCRHIEAVTANTLFHKVKFSLRKAFLIIFEMSTTTKGCSSPVLARKYGINKKRPGCLCSRLEMQWPAVSNIPLKVIVSWMR